MWLSSIVFQVTPNGGPNGPDPPWIAMPPEMSVKWICTDAALVAWTPPTMVPVSPGCSWSPRTNVAPSFTYSPLVMVMGPSMMHTWPAGTTTLWYVPGAKVFLHLVVMMSAVAAVLGTTTSRAAAVAPAASRLRHR